MSFDVSIVVLTYNSDKNKLFRTLQSAINQKNISFEIIVSDDGSNNFDIESIENCFKHYHFIDFRIITHETNLGTIKNLLEGVTCSSGKYIYSISPGDIFYNDTTISDLYSFAQKNNVEFCFGDASYYSIGSEKIELIKTQSPILPKLYNLYRKPFTIEKIGFFVGQHPVGATYFRKKETEIYYLQKVVDKVKYMEDFSTTSLFLLDGKKLYYCGFPVVWYEYGCGISTQKNAYFNSLINKDCDIINNMIHVLYSSDRIVQAKSAPRIIQAIKFPDVSLIGVIIKIISAIKFRFMHIDLSNLEKLEKIFENDI